MAPRFIHLMRTSRKSFTDLCCWLIFAVLVTSACSQASLLDRRSSPPNVQFELNQISSPVAIPPPRNLRFERLSPADGLSFPEVREVIQDNIGFMWVF
jgi:hypothetical protein